MPTSWQCTQCGASLETQSESGFCSRCLALSDAESFSTVQFSVTPQLQPAGAQGRAALPTPEQLAQYFPHLEVLELTGAGGMGAVYKARQPALDRLVAVKILPPSVGVDPSFSDRFMREARTLARLSHQNIVTVHDVGQSGGLFYFVMEFVAGLNLRQALQAARFDTARALDVALQICEALAYAHEEGVVHRDIKPANVLLDKRGRVKIADFGLAKLLAAPTAMTLTGSHQILGTPQYMAPEQIEHPQDVGHQADIYSLGVLLYEMLTGELPIGRFDPPSARAAVDARLDAIVLRALEKDPLRRHGTVAELHAQVAPLRAEFAPRTSELSASSSAIMMSNPLQPDSKNKPKSSPSLAPAVGIDLGTTYSAVAYIDASGRPVTLVNAEGDLVTPSLVLFDGQQPIVGKEALKAMSTEAQSVAQCAKRELGTRVYHRPLAGRTFPPEALQAFILNKLRLDASRQIGDFRKVVITVPAYFDELRRKATQDAGYMAGFEVLDIINEPTAAAISHGFHKGLVNPDGSFQQARKILVYDLGGGTFDVTAMEIEGDRFVALATDGDVQLGGQDWDQRLVNHVAARFTAEFNADPRADTNAAGRLWRECEDAKRTLSTRTSASISCEFHGHAARIKVTRDQFEELTQDLLDRTLFTTRQTLQLAGLTWADVDQVLLVGGSTRMPMVRRALSELSGKEPDASVSVDEAVAHGAALHAANLLARSSGGKPLIEFKSVNAHSLGVAATDLKTGRKRNAILIPRNTRLPVQAKRVFRTHKAAQHSILVQIVEGESNSPEDCLQLGQCVIRDLPADLPAQTPVSVRFTYKENGRLSVHVTVAGSDRETRQEIVRPHAFTPEQLDAWRAHVLGGEQVPTGEGAITL